MRASLRSQRIGTIPSACMIYLCVRSVPSSATISAGKRKAASFDTVSTRGYAAWTPADSAADGYDLPPTLKDWLYPDDGSTRDYASLQVVFGRGEEYFASDKDGKCEFKEPSVKKPTAVEDDPIVKQPLKRSRTTSILRPLSGVSVRSESAATDMSSRDRRTSSISSLRPSRPPSLSYSVTGSDSMSLHSVAEDQDLLSTSQSSAIAQWAPPDPNTAGWNMEADPPKTEEKLCGLWMGGAGKFRASLPAAAALVQGTGQSAHNRYNSRSAIETIPEVDQTTPGDVSPTTRHANCLRGHGKLELPAQSRPSYADASSQTDPIPTPLRNALRIDTTAASNWSTQNHVAVSHKIKTPVLEEEYCGFANTSFMFMFMGGMGMMDYFNKPGYQLGDGLARHFSYAEQPFYYHEPVYEYEYQDEFGPEALR
jgi:hypothetical protein